MACSQLFTLLTFIVYAVYCNMEQHLATNNKDGLHNAILVHTKYGMLRGVNESNIFKFKGVPFAQPPTDSLRFKRPRPPSSWSGVRDATQFQHYCHQLISPGITSLEGMDEDCLYLNVYSSKINNNSTGLLPVMVWIHGGSFLQGSGDTYDGTALAQKGVVVVTINYRLDVFGFLSTGNSEIPGNFGMLDQIMALKWVQENIATVGGDPSQVTIFGESSGSVSVSLLVLSPLAKGLFHRAIMESGVSLTAWAIRHPTSTMSHRSVAKLLGDKSGCSHQNNTLFLSCMQNVDAQTLLNHSLSLFFTLKSDLLWVPVVETTFGFLPDLPIKLLAEGLFNNVDTIRGFNADESGAGSITSDAEVTRNDFRNKIYGKLSLFTIPDKDILVNEFEDIYLGNWTDPAHITQQITAALTDYIFVAPTVNEITLAAKMLPEKSHYLYKFGYRRSVSEQPAWITAIHGDEIPFVFHHFTFPFWSERRAASKADKLVSNQMSTMWTNFAKSGNPTSSVPQGAVQWERFTPAHQRLLKINSKSILEQYNNTRIISLYKKFIQMVDNVTDVPDLIIG